MSLAKVDDFLKSKYSPLSKNNPMRNSHKLLLMSKLLFIFMLLATAHSV